jgi:diguanylate cyclase (GGDEF)-like protein
MDSPALPLHEPLRSSFLHSLGIAFTPAEARFDEITERVKKTFAVETVLLTIVNEDYQWFKSRQGLLCDQTSRDVSFCGHAIVTPEKLLIVEDARQDPRFADNPLVTGSPFIRFYAGCPLFFHSQAIGTLCLLHPKPRRLTEQEQEMLTSYARWVERELQFDTTHEAQKQLLIKVDNLQRQTLLDPLTQVFNRRAFDLLAEQSSYVYPLVLFFIDLDYFKKINDVYGHDAGDMVLMEAAQRLRRVLPENALLARYGGEEFVAVVSPCTQAQATELAELLRLSLATKPVYYGEQAITVTASFGFTVAQTPLPWRDLLKAADAALYQAKGAGRNRCIFQSPIF